MKCQKCGSDNREGVKFCEECGAKFELECPACRAKLPLSKKFCGECGYGLSKSEGTAAFKENDQATRISASPTEDTSAISIPAESERKHVTVLFSDLSGYTTMSEKLDPEEVKEITSRIFGEVSKIVANYNGFIEKYVGDAVMAIFGVPQAHEDDSIRAIKAARKIHQVVDAISPEVESKIGQSISMHTGINTGLVVTGEVNMERGTHGIAGDTINLASRLSNLAKSGEILIELNTCRQIEGHFECEYMETTTVKGKAEPVQVHKVLSQRNKPLTIHRISGLRSDLIGRKVELAKLEEAVKNLREGKGRIFSICGDAGTGKSRLVDDFKATLDLENIQWIEGHSYAHTKNIPYFPLIDLLNRLFHVEENDPPEKLREKVEFGIEHLIKKKDDVVPYVGGLYSLIYPEVEGVSPEFWKSRLQEAIRTIFAALANRTPTVFFLEDLHWADPSFVELLRRVCLEIRGPAIFMCVYRPIVTLFTSHQLSSIGRLHHEIWLQDLSPSDAQDMLESLLKTVSIPSDLKRFVQTRAEGNPFYLEELVNSLIESETLIRDNSSWIITRSFTESDISSSIHGLISGRLDRLEKETKRILQEASVIDRSFLYDILKKITEIKYCIDGELNILERVDLIRTRSIQPDLEYMFKHSLTQEVVYNGLLKKERQAIHEQIALVMENLFQDRLPEFYETLSFHFKKSHSVIKAVDYLMKSGDKSLKRYAVEGSHKYYKEAFDILTQVTNKSKDEDILLVDLLVKWAYVYYYRGDFLGLYCLFSTHKNLAENCADKQRVGMFYAWLGISHWLNGRAKKALQWLTKALQLGKKIRNQLVIGYTCNWLTYVYWELGQLDNAVVMGERAWVISKLFESDHYLFFKTLGGIGQLCFSSGDRKKAIEVGTSLLDFGRVRSDIRSIVVGHLCLGISHLIAGDFISGVRSFRKASQIAEDPFYTHYPRLFLGITYLLQGQFKEAENALREVLSYSKTFGGQLLGLYSYGYLGVVYVARGRMSQGLKMLKESIGGAIENERKSTHAQFEYTLGKVYLQLFNRAVPITFFTILNNLGFLIKNLPFASMRAESHLKNAIEISKDIGARSTLGQSYLDLGQLYKTKKRTKKAKECLNEAAKIFVKCDAEVYLKQAKEALVSIE